MKLDLGAGKRPREGFLGVDVVEGSDFRVDLFGPNAWPFEDGSVEEVWSSHLVEHIPHGDYREPDGFYRFFNEVWRICETGARVTIVHPYAKSQRAFKDPTHRRFITEETWAYLNREWLELTDLTHTTGFGGNFEMESLSADPVGPADGRVDDDMRGMYWDAVSDLTVVLRARD